MAQIKSWAGRPGSLWLTIAIIAYSSDTEAIVSMKDAPVAQLRGPAGSAGTGKRRPSPSLQAGQQKDALEVEGRGVSKWRAPVLRLLPRSLSTAPRARFSPVALKQRRSDGCLFLTRQASGGPGSVGKPERFRLCIYVPVMGGVKQNV